MGFGRREGIVKGTVTRCVRLLRLWYRRQGEQGATSVGAGQQPKDQVITLPEGDAEGRIYRCLRGA